MLFAEQVVLHVRIAQRVLFAACAVTGIRVPRHAAGDLVARGTADDLAGGVQERRAHSRGDGRDVEVAVVDQQAVVFVVQRTDIPVEEAVTDFEGAFQCRGETPGGQGRIGGTRNFPATATEVDVVGLQEQRVAIGIDVARNVGLVEVTIAVRVEVAAVADQGAAAIRVGLVDRAGHRHAEGGRLQRITGDLTLRLTLGVGQVRGEADVVGDVVVAADEQRTTLQRGQQVHLIGRTALVRSGLRVEVVGTDGIAALVGDRPGGAATDRVTLGVEHQCARGVAVELVGKAVVVTVLADRGQRGSRIPIRVGVGRERTILGPHAFFLVVLGADGQRAAVTGEAHDEVVGFLLAVALAVLALVDVGFQAIEVLAGDDVDHAGHCVRAVDRRGAVLQHVDALDHRGRDDRDVLVTIRADAQALAIDQHQRALCAEVAQVDVLTTGFLVGGQRRGAAEVRATGGGDVLQDVADRAEALVLDIRTRDGQHRLGGFHVNLADARTGDRDAVQIGGASGFLSDGAAGAGSAGDQREDDGVAQFVAVAVHWALSPS